MILPPSLAPDPISALCQLMPGEAVCYHVGTFQGPRTEAQAAAMRCASELADAGRVHLVQSVLSRTAEGVSTFAYLAIGRPLPAKKRRMR